MKFTARNNEEAVGSIGQGNTRRTVKTELEPNEATRVGVYVFGIVMFALGFGIVFAATFVWLSIITVVSSVCAGLLFMACIRIAPQWERVAILRFGKFNRVAGPGLYVLIPFVEYAAIHVDQRIMNSAFSAEAVLTADLVPVDVDAILFWLVWDAKKACLEVSNYPKSVIRSAQTALRDAIGQVNLADVSTRRKQMDHDLEEVLGKKCEEWGITVLSVEIRDITIPRELEHALSREAQAQRERNARLLLAEVEKDISEMFVEAAEIYDENPNALQLRAMNLAYEGAKEGKGILLAPSALADSFDVSKLFKAD